jgi:hypothetical protein
MTSSWQHAGAFVIQLQSETDLAAGRFEGRAEHVASGQTTHFHKPDELLAFLNDVLQAALANGSAPIRRDA